MRRICVFTGSRRGADARYRAAVEALGRLLAGRGIGVVFGAGRFGLMGALAGAALAAGGEVIGVIPRPLLGIEPPCEGLTELRVVGSMHERKALMAELSDGFVAAPGGLGTIEEAMEVITWAQLGFHRKPIGLLNVGGYFDGLVAFLRHAAAEGFVAPGDLDLFRNCADPAELIDRMARHAPPPGPAPRRMEEA